MRSLPILVLILLTLAFPAFAGDGVLEINQTCAVQTGCFPGDTAGFPVTISASGSYRLTSNLNYPSATADAINLAASDVALDLNGNTIKGTNTCTVGPSGWVTSCSESSFFGGAIVPAGVRHRVTNGRVVGARGIGIRLGDASEVRNVQVSDCSDDGIRVGWRSSISSVSAIGNGGSGIVGQQGSVLVRDSIAINNGFEGIFLSVGSISSGNMANANELFGITVGAGSTASGNTANGNGQSGIRSDLGSTISGNTVLGNAGFGLSLGPQSGYRENVISSNTGGTVDGTGLVNLGSNACNGSATCP